MPELACQWRIFILSGKVLYRGTLRVWARVTNRKERETFTEKYDDEDNNKTIDPASRDEQVPTWMWLPGLVVVLVMACVVMKNQFDMPVGEILLALFLAFFFSFLAIQSTGATGEDNASPEATLLIGDRHHTINCRIESFSDNTWGNNEWSRLDFTTSTEIEPHRWGTCKYWSKSSRR
jgi:hypothetical protein